MLHIAKTYAVESVTSGHPDKICDQISDAILDECLKQDPQTRAGIEVLGSHGYLMIGGEVTTNAQFNAEKIARKIYTEIGYQDTLKIYTHIAKQSKDIAQGVDTGGAGDQGIMYGFATGENTSFLPDALVKAHRLAKKLEDLRKNDQNFAWIKPDGKTEIIVENEKITTILVSVQHTDQTPQEFIKNQVLEYVIQPIIGEAANLNILVNPTGKFTQGGFEADAGLTGRKIMVDTYGGLISHGGGCFSGKDPTKVDRSATYMARFAAKNIVANGYAKKCLVSVAYAIGQAEPLMVEAISEKGESLNNLVKEKFDFRPQAIIERLNLQTPIYLQTAAYGHFSNPKLPWEQIVAL